MRKRDEFDTFTRTQRMATQGADSLQMGKRLHNHPMVFLMVLAVAAY